MLMDPSSPLPSPHLARLLEVHEVAYQLKSSQETVLRLIRKRKLAAIRLGTRSWRIDPVDLQAFLDAQRIASEKNGDDTRPPKTTTRRGRGRGAKGS